MKARVELVIRDEDGKILVEEGSYAGGRRQKGTNWKEIKTNPNREPPNLGIVRVLEILAPSGSQYMDRALAEGTSA